MVGFGALTATGAFARKARASEAARRSPAVANFFRPGHNLAGRALYLVPLAGAGLLALGHGADVGKAWPWIGLGLWVVAAGLATGSLWPAERRLQRLVANDGAELVAIADEARRIERAAAACTVVFVVAVAVMLVQP